LGLKMRGGEKSGQDLGKWGDSRDVGNHILGGRRDRGGDKKVIKGNPRVMGEILLVIQQS